MNIEWGLNMAAELLALASVVTAMIAALFAYLAFANSRKGRADPPPLAKYDAMQMFRTETDTLKAAGDERERRLEKKLDTDFARIGLEANSNRDALRTLVEGKLDDSAAKQAAAVREFREDASGSIQTLGRGIATAVEQLSQQQKERLDDVKKAFEGQTEQNTKAQEALRQAVESRLDAIRNESASKLEEMRLTVDEKLQATLETRLDQSFTRIVEQISKVYEQIGEMKTLATSVGNLNNTLSNVKNRGTFGEVHLALIVDEFLTPEQYVRNAQIKDNSTDRVEYAIKFKSGREGQEVLLAVDAKFPREDYERLLEATEAGDTQSVLKFRKQLENRIKFSAKDINEKFINPPRTTDFAVLFLPTESLYAEALRLPGLFEYLQREFHVTLAGPTTFSAILSAFRMNFQSLAIAHKTAEIWKVLSAVRTEFGRYNKVVSGLDRQLRAASSSIEHLGQRTRAMDHKLRTLEVLPNDGSAEKLLGLTDSDIGPDDEEDFANGRAPTPADLNGTEDAMGQAAE